MLISGVTFRSSTRLLEYRLYVKAHKCQGHNPQLQCALCCSHQIQPNIIFDQNSIASDAYAYLTWEGWAFDVGRLGVCLSQLTKYFACIS